ncbi:MAG: YebC/PmpR family DNA-binding transcriptional regulator [Planctomycetota bacterium]|nr:YebC/PmpR family DNA-binding transcriptional regulator [Planctomycetota bacterium]
MAGHSHAANVKRRKDSVNAKKAKIFSKCAKHLDSAVRVGGPDPTQNPRLGLAIEKARAANMPKDNIDRAIKKAAGEKDGAEYLELVYEGYGPGGVALMISCLTDNRNRTAPDIKFLLEKRGGNLGAQGSVSFLFDMRSVFVVDCDDKEEEELMEEAMEAGAEDVVLDDGVATFYGDATEFIELKAGLEAAGYEEFISAEISYVPQTRMPLESPEDAKKIQGIIDALEDNDDVQTVSGNHSFPPEWLE